MDVQNKILENKPHVVNQVARVAKNSFMLLVANVIDLIFGLVLIAIFARYLGVKVYGQYVFIISMVSIFSTIPHFGFRRIIMREVAKEKNNANRYLGSVIIIRCVLSTLAFAAIAITIKLLGLSGNYITAAYIIMASALTTVLSKSFITIFLAFEKMKYNTYLTVINRAIGITLIIAVVYYDLGFILLLVAIFIPNILTLLLSYVWVARKIGKPKFEFDPKRWKFLLKESYPLFIELVLRQNFLRVDVFVLKALSSASEISLFYAPYSLILRLQKIPASLSTALLPSLARLADKSKTSFVATYASAFKFLFIISLPIAIIVTLFADKIILIILGADFLAGAIVLKILIWMINLMFLESLFNAVLVSIGKQLFSSVSHGAMFIVNLILDILLIPYYGVVGACIGTLCAYVTRFFMSYYFISKNNITLPISNILPKPIFSGAVMGITIYLVRDLNMIFSISIGLASYVGVIILTGTFSKEEIGLLKNALNIRRQNLHTKSLKL